ncbi:serine protease [Candidatus Pacebacteria bacterium]|nr:serine protease [Candidatus Paceibacterota bacterium]
MQILTDALIAILALYVALTGAMADGIAAVLPEQLSHAPTRERVTDPPTIDDTQSLAVLNSEYRDSETIPDILRQNAYSQQASVIGSLGNTRAPAEDVNDALVNIYCTYTTDTEIRTTTGSGFFIDSDGVIMTNAHVAQFLLLEQVSETGSTECTIRSGDPAEAKYVAELLYISPAWIQKHAHLIDAARPRGTGERDYALLYVTAGVDKAPMPAHFPYLAVETDLLRQRALGDTVTVAGYPAGSLATDGGGTPLSPQSDSAAITQMYTFGSNYADIFTIDASTVGEYGVSGGPVLNRDGAVIGLVTTKGGPEDNPGSLRALTLSYVDRTMIEESTFDLAATSNGQLAFRARLFTETIIPFLARVLEAEL